MSLEDNLKRGFEAFERGDYPAASDLARAVLRESPKNSGGLMLTGRLALVAQRLDVALSIFTGLTQEPSPAAVWIDLARTLVALRREEDAVEAARAAVDLDPESIDGFVTLGEICLSLNVPDRAAQAFRRAQQMDFAETRAYLGLSRCMDLAVGSPEVAAMQALIKLPAMPKPRLAHLHYALSSTYKAAGDADKFFKHLAEAHAAQKAANPGSRESYRVIFDRLEQAFIRDKFVQAVGAGPSTPTPIFILGMPRSGTTLVEQIIGGHPDVAVGEELQYGRQTFTPAFEQLTGRPFPEGYETLGGAKMNELARQWTQFLSMIARGKTFITDKSPGNFHMIGMLLLLFPEAKIINLRRDPMDVCFSILQQPFEVNAPHTYDEDLLAYYYARYERLMALWESYLSNRILGVRYETLVRQPEAEGRRIMNFCGLAWDPSLLNVHQRNRAVHTFSAQQVRQPINTASIGAWRKYERQLAPMRKALESVGVL